jgi:hypothetical protein
MHPVEEAFWPHLIRLKHFRIKSLFLKSKSSPVVRMRKFKTMADYTYQEEEKCYRQYQ